MAEKPDKQHKQSFSSKNDISILKDTNMHKQSFSPKNDISILKNTDMHIPKRHRAYVIHSFKIQPDIWQIFCGLDKKYREELISFCMGGQGLKITYDTIFRLVMDPVKHPERLESFLSAILGTKIKIVEILDREGVHMTEKSSFVIMDILVKTADGRYINIEMQKLGYAFPLERTDCYVADLIMRQYNDIKQEKKENFRFSDLSKVITIVIMETSFGEFQKDTVHAIHHRTSIFDTGLNADGLSENYYVCLDTYRKFVHTKIKDKKDAWLLFLGSTNINDILEVCNAFPEFIPLYENVFELQKDVRGLMNMFSEALRIMDRNTEKYMVEMVQKELDDTKSQLQQLGSELQQRDSKLQQRDIEIAELRRQLAELQK